MSLPRGLLLSPKIVDNHRLYVLVFKCPHCMKEHSSYVSITPDYYTKDISSNIWYIRINMKEENKALLDIHPSFNNSKDCGWHSTYNWKVKVMILDEHQYRNKETDEWINA